MSSPRPENPAAPSTVKGWEVATDGLSNPRPRDPWRLKGPVRKGLAAAWWRVAAGKDSQSFLGARWVPRLLRFVPERSRRRWALRILALSPHYFLDREHSDYAGMSHDEYLEAASRASEKSRGDACRVILESHLTGSMTILDYGCGPGYLAKVAAQRVRRVFACDISTGVLSCAQILNGADNLTFLPASDAGLGVIPDGSLDLVFSLAVVQHLTDAGFDSMLVNTAAKLKTGGLLLVHIQLEDEDWRSEESWRTDESLTGRLRYRWGLHCFSRRESDCWERLRRHGFDAIERTALRDPADGSLFPTQVLFTARKVG